MHTHTHAHTHTYTHARTHTHTNTYTHISTLTYWQGTTVDELLELMDMGLSGKHIADLVSSGAQLSRVRTVLERVGCTSDPNARQLSLAVLECMVWHVLVYLYV